MVGAGKFLICWGLPAPCLITIHLQTGSVPQPGSTSDLKYLKPENKKVQQVRRLPQPLPIGCKEIPP
jgi:hypothetical protein